jgi:hypothetical protein
VLVRGLTGYASSLAAVTGVSDLDVAMLVSRRRVGEYMVATGRDFRDLVAAKRERGMFQEFSTGVPTPRPTPSQTVETRSKSAVFRVSKHDGRAGEI